MALKTGTRIGPYEILSPLGEGGMGEVYRARDTNLSREVAIKALRDAFAHDAQRLARFEREARSLAAVNHPGIGAIYGIERSDFGLFLVLELVPGETLAKRLDRGAVPVAEALEIFHQVAEALEAAHAKGLIHRDLKPANVMIEPDGRVKLLDFGLAKGVERATLGSDQSQSPTLTSAPTSDGVILGTAAYMSPEQARGRPVDQRTDIWSFGCVLYETLTGKRAFAGETITDTLAAVLEKEPDWRALPEGTPWMLQSLLRRCLRKDTKRRMHHIADARIEIDDAMDPSIIHASGGPSSGENAATANSLQRWMLFGVLAALGLVAAHEFDRESHFSFQSTFGLVLLVIASLAMAGVSWNAVRSLGTPFWTGVSCGAAVWLLSILMIPIEWGLLSQFAHKGTAEPELTHFCVRVGIYVRFLYPGLAVLAAYQLLSSKSQTSRTGTSGPAPIARLLAHRTVGVSFAALNAILFVVLAYGLLVLPFELLALARSDR